MYSATYSLITKTLQSWAVQMMSAAFGAFSFNPNQCFPPHLYFCNQDVGEGVNHHIYILYFVTFHVNCMDIVAQINTQALNRRPALP